MNDKISNQLLKFQHVFWLNKSIPIIDKRRIYLNLILPQITYGIEVWHQYVKDKSSYLNKLSSLQSKVIRTLTGAYKSSNRLKLLEITKIIPIEKELEIQCEINDLDRQEKRS